MGLPKDGPLTIESRRSLEYPLIRPDFYFYRQIICLLALCLLLTSALAEDVYSCQIPSSEKQIYAIDPPGKEIIFSIENGDVENPLNLVSFHLDGESCKKNVIARYQYEGGVPSVDSIFLENVDGKLNLFVIVHWEVNHRGIGTYGSLYQVYAYKRSEAGLFVENKKIVNSSSMTGIDGYEGGRAVAFLYKTAGEVKRWLRK